jgi:hypothetical protein
MRGVTVASLIMGTVTAAAGVFDPACNVDQREALRSTHVRARFLPRTLQSRATARILQRRARKVIILKAHSILSSRRLGVLAAP